MPALRLALNTLSNGSYGWQVEQQDFRFIISMDRNCRFIPDGNTIGGANVLAVDGNVAFDNLNPNAAICLHLINALLVFQQRPTG